MPSRFTQLLEDLTAEYFQLQKEVSDLRLENSRLTADAAEADLPSINAPDTEPERVWSFVVDDTSDPRGEPRSWSTELVQEESTDLSHILPHSKGHETSHKDRNQDLVTSATNVKRGVLAKVRSTTRSMRSSEGAFKKTGTSSEDSKRQALDLIGVSFGKAQSVSTQGGESTGSRSHGLSSGSRSTSDEEYSIFLSHKQANGQDAVLAMKMLLAERLPLASFWLDLEQNPTEDGMMDGVEQCTHFLLFCTAGIMKSKFVLMEIRRAIELEKTIILVHETDARHGAPDIGQLTQEAPEDLRHIFEGCVSIPWYREPAFRAVSLDKICCLLRAKVFDGDSVGSEDLMLAYGSTGELVFDKCFAIFCSFAGLPLPGASRLAQRWKFCVQLLLPLLIPGPVGRMCFPGGPASLDYRDEAFILAAVVLMPLANLGLLSILKSSTLRAVLDSGIKSHEIARRLRIYTRWLAFAGATLVTLVTTAFHYMYTWQHLHPHYREQSVMHQIVHLVSFSAYLVSALPFFAQLFCGFVITIAIQTLVVMNLASSLNALGVEIESPAGRIVQCSDAQIVRFQVAYVEAWRNFRTICGKLSLSYYMLAVAVFSVNYVGQLVYTVRGLVGVDHPWAEQGAPWYLLLRTLCPVIGDALVLVPFISTYFMRRAQSWVCQLLFTKPGMQVAAVTFIKQFDVDFPLGPIRASPALFPFCLALVISRSVLWACELHWLVS